MKQALMAAGFSPDVLGASTGTGLVVGQEDCDKVHADMDPSDYPRARRYLSGVEARWPLLSDTQHRLGKMGRSCPPEVLDKRRLLVQAVTEQYNQDLAGHFLIGAALNEHAGRAPCRSQCPSGV